MLELQFIPMMHWGNISFTSLNRKGTLACLEITMVYMCMHTWQDLATLKDKA